MLFSADKNGIEQRIIEDLLFDADTLQMDFEISGPGSSWDPEITYESRIYVPDTEFGGIITAIQTNSQTDKVIASGDTWRGILNSKVIEPPEGTDYMIKEGELYEVIADLLQLYELDSVFSPFPPEDKPSFMVSYQFDRYTTLLEGLIKMLAKYNKRLVIAYKRTPTGGSVFVDYADIKDLSNEIQVDQDGLLHFTIKKDKRTVNHLICLGKGELRNRVVKHLYINAYGQVSDWRYYSGWLEKAKIYDNNNAEEAELIEKGTEELLKLQKDKEKVQVTLNPSQMDILSQAGIGDLISGRDRITGISVSKPIAGMIFKNDHGQEKIEIKLQEDKAHEY